MLFKFTLRLIFGTTPKILWKFIWNMCWKATRSLARFNKRQKEGKFFPAFMIVSITNNCNLSCKGCWVTQTEPTYLPIEELDQLIIESKQQGCYFFGILGGEPLLYPNLLEIFRGHSDCYFQLFTNGTLIDDDFASNLAKVGNVTPVISIEGLEDESDKRRGGENVFSSSIEGIKICRRHKLITGVATSVCSSNFDELVTKKFAQDVLELGVHYLWYYIYRPVGAEPSYELLLNQDQILALRKFILKLRATMPLLIVDAYWDHLGRALCPAATGISHHINPRGQIEPCPIIQFAAESIGSKPLFETFNESEYLREMRKFMTHHTRGCILMEEPKKLAEFLVKFKAIDSTGRKTGLEELRKIPVCCSHNIPGQELPETHPIYKFAKKHYFFGFGAYG